MRKLFAGAIATIIAVALAPSYQVKTAAALKAEDDFLLVRVADGVYAAIAKPGGLASGNAGFVIGDGGVLVFDTFFTPFTPAAIEELIGEIQTLTKLPIKYAVNSHYHLDHTGGNQVLVARGVAIIAHDNLIKWQTTKNRRFHAQCRRHVQRVEGDEADELTPSFTQQAAKSYFRLLPHQSGAGIAAIASRE
jgi:glyoxylase-like metal-dependent hydrolase (beta-lactamase superfamily II)